MSAQKTAQQRKAWTYICELNRSTLQF